MLKFLTKTYPFLIVIFVIYYYSSDLKQNFKHIKFKTENNNGINLTISTNWFKINDLGHNVIQIDKKYNPNHSGIISCNYYFGENRDERIDSVINIEWLKNDSLVVIITKLITNKVKTDSLFWLKK